MALINVTNIKIGNNFVPIQSPLVFQIEFECLEDLKNDVEWKIIYVTSDGSGYEKDTLEEAMDYLKSDNQGEIVLDAVCLGPVYRGILEFEFRVNPPDYARMNPNCILGMQAVLITASYCDQEFIRIGYYTNNTYDDETLRENPPDEPIFDKMVRCIIDQPRVTRFPIRWDSEDLVDDEGNNLNCLINDAESSEEESEQSEEDSEERSLDNSESASSPEASAEGDNGDSPVDSGETPDEENNGQEEENNKKRKLEESPSPTLDSAEDVKRVVDADKFATMATCTSISDVATL